MLYKDAMTVTGASLADNLDRSEYVTSEHVRDLSNPISTQASLLIMKGSLSPEGGILKRGNAAEKAETLRGKARVFGGQADAIAALGRGEITPGTIAVLRGMGPKGGPGVALASSFVAAVDGAGLSKTVAVVTDGQLSGLNRGIAIGQVCPEAAAGGPIAYVQDGDEILINTATRTVDLLVEEREMNARIQASSPWEPAKERGWLSVYARTVQPLAKGAVLTLSEETHNRGDTK
jgi:dihydroxy-acid dehydratase